MKYTYKFVVDRVVDGDTVDGFIQLGMNISVFKRIRLNGIDAPETRTKDLEEKKRGKKAKKWLDERLREDSPITITTLKDSTGKYGRILAELYVGGKHVQSEMLARGLAEVYK